MKKNTKDTLKEITEMLEEGVKNVFTSERYATYLKTIAKFPSYSARNSLLIMLQDPNASYIAGYKAWQTNFERHVKQGAKSLKIIAPHTFKKKVLVNKLDANNKPMLDGTGKNIKEEQEVIVPTFRVISVFDVSQTEGKELPRLTKELTGTIDNLKDFLAAIEDIAPCPIRFDDISSNAKGYYSLTNKEIVIQKGMSDIHTIKTAIHELAHSVLHDYDNVPKDNEVAKDRHTKEVEAESIAFTVCSYYGLDTSEYSFGYIASWSKSKELTELQSSLNVIQKTAGNIISKLDEHTVEREKASIKDKIKSNKELLANDANKKTKKGVLEHDTI